MKKVRIGLAVAVLVACVLTVGLLNTGCNFGGRFSASIDVTIPSDLKFPSPLPNIDDLTNPTLEPGEALPLGYKSPQIPVCSLPTMDEIKDMVAQKVGNWLVNKITIDSIALEQTTMVAKSGGDFSDLTYVQVCWYGNGDDTNICRLLGEAEDEDGFGDEVALELLAPLDFQLILEEGSGEAPDCAGVGVAMDGVVPPADLVWQLKVKIKVEGSVGL